jgi:hypothetical protein
VRSVVGLRPASGNDEALNPQLTGIGAEARDQSGQQLGRDGIVALLDRLDAASPETVIDELRRELARSGRCDGVQDDLTLLLIRHTGMRATSTPIKSL